MTKWIRFTKQAPTGVEFPARLVHALRGGSYMKSLLAFEKRDVWVGLYWDPTNIERAYAEDFVRSTFRWRVNVYICPLPCCLIRFAVEFGTPRWKRGDMTDFNAGRDKTNAEIDRRRLAEQRAGACTCNRNHVDDDEHSPTCGQRSGDGKR